MKKTIVFDTGASTNIGNHFECSLKTNIEFHPPHDAKIEIDDVRIEWSKFMNINPTNSSFILDTDIVTLPNGVYSESALATALQTALNSSATKSATTWTVTYNSITLKYTMTQSGTAYSTLIGFLCDVFGFSAGVYGSVFTSSFVPTFGHPRFLHFVLSSFVTDESSFNGAFHSTFFLPLVKKFDSCIESKKSSVELKYSDLQTLKIIVHDQDGKLIYYPAPWGFTINFFIKNQ